MWESTITNTASFAHIVEEIKKEKEFKTKIDQVGKLVDVAVFLNIFHDRLFDNLMDKYEKAPDLFEYTYSTISSMIYRKYDIEMLKEKYLELISMNNINQIKEFTYF